MAYPAAQESSPESVQANITELHPEDADAKVRDEEERERLIDQFRMRFNQAREHSRDWREEARALYDMRAGSQWSAEDEATLREQLRPMVTFNVADKYIDAVSGLQINNRQEIRFLPRKIGEAAPDEILTGAVKYCRDETDAEDEETESFIDLTLVGMGWTEGFLDTDRNPEGIAAMERRDPLDMYWDPFARKRNLADSKWLCRILLMDPEEFEERFPDAAITASNWGDLRTVVTEFDTQDTGITIIEEPQDYQRNRSMFSTSRTKIAVADYQYWEHEYTYSVRTPENSVDGLTRAQATKLEQRLKEAKILYAETRTKKRCYYRCYFAGNTLLKRSKLPYDEGFTYFAKTGKRDRNRNTWYGIGRGLKDPQMWVNKFFSQILHVINTNAKGGLLAEENTFVDKRKAEADWARTDAIIELKSGALANNKIQPRTPPQYPEGMDRLMNFSLMMLPQVSGLNPEIIGLADRDQPGVLEAQRKQAAMAIIAWCFDAMRLYYRQAGRWYASYIRKFMSDGRLVKIVGKQGARYIPLLRDALAFEYDIVVDEAPTSVNMKERVFAAIQVVLPIAAKMGIPIPQEILDYLPIPQDLAEAWKKKTAPTPEQQAAAKLDMDEKQAKVNETNANANLKNAQAEKAKAEAGQSGQNGVPLDPNQALQNHADAQMEKLKATLENQINEAKQNRDAELKLMLESLKEDSAERIASLQAAITLASATTQTKGADGESKTESTPIEEDPVLEVLMKITEKLEQLKGPRKMVYDDKGELARIE